jgi:putative membrane protein
MMIDDHKKDIDDFKRATQTAKDPDIQALAGNAIPVLQKHLDSTRLLTV